MQALVYHGPDRKQWESKPDPKLEHPSDAILQIDTATICGTDLHILKGDVPTCAEGAPWATRRSGRWSRPATPWRTCAKATASWSPASRPAGAASTAGRRCTGSARAAAAGSWAT